MFHGLSANVRLPRFDAPSVAALWPWLLAALTLLVPAALLCALFCARRGVERGRTLPWGILPGWLFFGGLLAVLGWLGGVPPFAREVPALGWLLLAGFAALRADPPTPMRVSVGWALGAGLAAALGFHDHLGAFGGIYGLWLYVWLSAGWWPAAAFGVVGVVSLAVFVDGMRWPGVLGSAVLVQGCLGFCVATLGGFRWRPQLPSSVTTMTNPVTPDLTLVASAHRVTSVLFFLALMGALMVVFGAMTSQPLADYWAFVLVPLALAVGLMLTDALASWTIKS